MANPETNVDLWLNWDLVSDIDTGFVSATFTATAATGQTQSVVAVGTETFAAVVTAAQAQSATAVGVETFAFTAVSGQGTQSTSATATWSCVATGVTGQASQSTSAATTETFVVAATTSQAQAAVVTASQMFAAWGLTGQAGQTADATGVEAFIADVAGTGQGQGSSGVGFNVLRPFPLSQRLQVADYEETFQSGNLLSDKHNGRLHARPRTLKGPRPIAGSLVLSSADKVTLDLFYEQETGNGALTFSWRNPLTNEFPVRFKFTDAPKFTSMGGDTIRAALSLELLA